MNRFDTRLPSLASKFFSNLTEKLGLYTLQFVDHVRQCTPTPYEIGEVI